MIKNTALLKKCEPLYSGDIADRLGKFRGVVAIGNRLFWVYGLIARGQTILSALLWKVKPKEHYHEPAPIRDHVPHSTIEAGCILRCKSHEYVVCVGRERIWPSDEMTEERFEQLGLGI